MFVKFLLSAVLLVLPTYGWGQAPSKVFYTVDVIGLDRLSKGDLIDLLKPFMGKPFGVEEKKQMQQAFLDVSFFRSVAIKEAKDQTLQLYIQERIPMLAYKEQAAFMDMDGRWFEPFGSWVQESTIPILITSAKSAADVLEIRKKEALMIVQSPCAQKHPLRSLEWDDQKGWILQAQEVSVPIWLGKRDLLERMIKLEKTFEKILSQKEKIHAVNLRFRGRVVLELKPLS